jgi:hypothetical protein
MKSKKEPKENVIFLIHKDDNDVFAYFPNMDESHGGCKRVTAYCHIGQHTFASPEYAKQSRLATEEQYKDLKKELEEVVGYNLRVLKTKRAI